MQTVMDFFLPSLDSHMQELKYKNLVARWWPKEIVNGAEVFANRIYIYPFHLQTPDTVKLLRFLKLTEKIKSNSYKGIENAYLYLNSKDSKYSKDLIAKEMITVQIEQHMNIDKWYYYDLNFVVPDSTLTFKSMTPEALQAHLLANYNKYQTAGNITIASEIDFIDHFARFIPYASTFDFKTEVVGIQRESREIYKTFTANGVSVSRVIGYTLSVTMSMRAMRLSPINEAEPLITRIFNARSSNTQEGRAANAMMYQDTQQIVDIVDPVSGLVTGTELVTYDNVLPTNNLYFEAGLLKRSLTSQVNMRTHSFVLLFNKILDFGYKKKKTKKKWYSVIIKIVIVIISIVIFVVVLVLTSGNFAMAMSAVSMFYAAVSYFAARLGDQDLAQFAMKWSVTTGKIAAVLAIIQIADTAYQMVADAALEATRQAAIDATRQAGGDVAAAMARDYVVDWAQVNIIDIAIDLIKDYFTSSGTSVISAFTEPTFASALKIANLGLEVYSKIDAMQRENKIEDMAKKVSTSQAEIDTVLAAQEAKDSDPRQLYVLQQSSYEQIANDMAIFRYPETLGVGTYRNIGPEPVPMWYNRKV